MRGGKVTHIYIGIGHEASQQDDRIHQEARAVGHGGEERDQKEPINQVMRPKCDHGGAIQFWLVGSLSRIFLEPREPRGGVKLQDKSKQCANDR